MRIITVELLNENALSLLKQLEQLKVLRVIASKDRAEQPKRKWAGSISKETAKKMLKHTDQSRDEWERNT